MGKNLDFIPPRQKKMNEKQEKLTKTKAITKIKRLNAGPEPAKTSTAKYLWPLLSSDGVNNYKLLRLRACSSEVEHPACTGKVEIAKFSRSTSFKCGFDKRPKSGVS